MKGDFTRDTFDPRNHFSRVLMQQGRVQLDADANEQAAILLHYLRALAADLIGPHGGPADIVDSANKLLKVNCGFEIIATENRIDDLPEPNEEKTRLKELLKQSKLPLLLGKGHYYVDGVLCESSDYVAYSGQMGYPFPGQPEQFASGQSYLVYLDVWERHLTYLEMEDADGSVISIREAALNGPDTATRTQVVWQVKAINKAPGGQSDIPNNKADVNRAWPSWVDRWQPANRGQLKARAIQAASAPDDPCLIPPDSRYRGAENQLYRVEIHEGSTASGGAASGGATFTWSRDNGSVIFPIVRIAGANVELENLGRDARFGLQVGDWVEIVDDDYTLQNRAESLLQVDAIDYDANLVTLNEKPAPTVGQDPQKHPLLRRWDQRKTDKSTPSSDGMAISESTSDWIELEDGIQIQFQPGGTYRTGDYWLIPARTATGDVEWPGPAGAPVALGPRGIMHSYAPLWIISVVAGGAVTADPANDLRRNIKPLWLP